MVEEGTAGERAAALEAAAEREAALDSAAEREAALDSARVAAAPLGWGVKSAGRGARHAFLAPPRKEGAALRPPLTAKKTTQSFML